MDEPKSLDSLFKEKILRIPDYQRGYAWQKEQLKDFWEDLINLAEKRNHYTGVLTLKEVDLRTVTAESNEFWLVDDHSYKVYHIVDGQQRLTTFIIFIQAFLEFFEELPENRDKADDQVYVTESLTLKNIREKYLFMSKPSGNQYRTYKFGYTADNPSYEFLRYRIFGEPGAGTIQDTFYTLNLRNAKKYFVEQLREYEQVEGLNGVQEVFRKVTKRFLFNEYVIKDEFDVFVAFETMNNRGKKLSDLELLKNRLIYLTTLYPDQELDAAEQKSLRDQINETWKEVYHQLGRNEKRPLNDDDFLKAHWTMYFKYSRKRGNDYIRFLLDEQFSPNNVHEKVEQDVELESVEEQRDDLELDDPEDETAVEDQQTVLASRLSPVEIRDYVNSLKTSAVHWFNSHFPFFNNDLSDAVKIRIDRLNRAGMGYFRPLVMSILKNVTGESDRVRVLEAIESSVFICFHLAQARRNYRDSEYYNAARELDRGEINCEKILEKLDQTCDFSFDEQGNFRTEDFVNYLAKKFRDGSQGGYYSWHGLRYFLYEYETSLLDKSRQQKVSWDDLLKTAKDKISIEHIFPQTPSNGYWAKHFASVNRGVVHQYQGTLGNLLLLSQSINSSLQNDGFPDKKNVKVDASGNKIRNGYSDGSHSEIEVAAYDDWTPDAIKKRGLRMVDFMEKRWNLKFVDQTQKEQLLFLP